MISRKSIHTTKSIHTMKSKQKTEHLFKAAIHCQESGRYDEAQKIYQEILQVNPEHSETWFSLGLIRQENNLIHEAVKAFCEAARLNPQYHGFLFSFGLSLVSKKNIDEAIVVMNCLLKLQPEVAEVHYSLGLIYFHQQQLTFAEQLFKKAIELKKEYAGAHKDLGRVLMESKRFAEALESLKEAVSLDPQCHEAFRFMGDINRELGEYEKAVQAYRAEHALAPDRVECVLDIGLTYLRQQNYGKAVEVFKHVVNQAPNLTEAHYNLGLSYHKQKKYALAVHAYTSVLEVDPDNAAAHNDLGMVYDLLGRPEEAISHYKEVARIEPDNRVAKHILAALTGEQLQNAHPDYVVSLFDQYSELFEVELVEKLKYTVPTKLMETVSEHCNGMVQFDNVLDLGCGTGMCGQEFRPVSAKITGVDLSSKMLALASRKKVYSSLVQQDIVRYLNKSHELYDLFIAADVFIYVGALDAVFDAVRKNSLPQGYFTFSVESCNGSSFWLSPSGRFMHSRNYIQKLADTYLFEIEQCTPTGIRLENKAWIPGDLYILKSNCGLPFQQAHLADFVVGNQFGRRYVSAARGGKYTDL